MKSNLRLNLKKIIEFDFCILYVCNFCMREIFTIDYKFHSIKLRIEFETETNFYEIKQIFL